MHLSSNSLLTNNFSIIGIILSLVFFSFSSLTLNEIKHMMYFNIAKSTM